MLFYLGAIYIFINLFIHSFFLFIYLFNYLLIYLKCQDGQGYWPQITCLDFGTRIKTLIAIYKY